MKNLKPVAMIALVIAGLALTSCGKTKRYDSVSSTSVGGPVVVPPITPIPTPTPTPTPTPSGIAPYSYEFTRLGNQTYTTGTITTDNVLKVKFKVTAEQGNHVWKASELKVTILVNGYEVTPTYTSSNYLYGYVGETSNVIDLTPYITPGVPVQITVKLPKNDFYCTYPYSNPEYQQYPGCRKEVYSTHNWSGVLTVQTSATTAI